ncbi:hypothetical protein GCM10027035_31600 [Emticicia sediminis]
MLRHFYYPNFAQKTAKHIKYLLTLLIFDGIFLYTKAQNIYNKMEIKKPYTILILMNATPKWLSHTREERITFFEKKVIPVFQKVSKSVKVQLFDSEYFLAKVSDFMIVTATSLDDYKLLIELLRDTKIYAEPYFEIKDIIVGEENAFKDFNELLKK